MAFVQTFGITQPTPEGARKAARVLGWVLLVGMVGAGVLSFSIYQTWKAR